MLRLKAAVTAKNKGVIIHRALKTFKKKELPRKWAKNLKNGESLRSVNIQYE
ncbi:MAG: hypothetical protein ACJAZP_003722 [Psychromonas sp.]|jgi:hypothetical protein